MIPRLNRTNTSDPDFIKLVTLLDEELAIRDGDEHAFYNQFNHIDGLDHVVILKEKGQAIGCGAIKALSKVSMEIKRMYVSKDVRGRGYAGLILEELEKWILELGYSHSRLETGKRQPEAIALYERKGYQRIPNYGQYANVLNSLCFEKSLEADKT